LRALVELDAVAFDEVGFFVEWELVVDCFCFDALTEAGNADGVQTSSHTRTEIILRVTTSCDMPESIASDEQFESP
jgi:hypothetical protein